MEDEREIQLQVQCRDGPIRDRRCTDWGCCLVYFLLLGAIIVLAVIHSQQTQISPTALNSLLK